MSRNKVEQSAGVGPAVRRLRLAAMLTQAELAERAGIATETLSRIETGRMPSVSVRTCGKLAHALGVLVSELFKDIPEPKRNLLRRSELALLALVGGMDEAQVNDLVRGLKLFMRVRRGTKARLDQVERKRR